MSTTRGQRHEGRAAQALASLAALAVTVVGAGAAHAAEEADPDRTLAPYFVVQGDGDDAVERLPLKETRADVTVSGVIAHVRVTQVYENAGDVPLEAIYVFPGSTRAAVFGMRMTVGERVITAQIQEKEQARKLYERAKSQGKSASLLEQKRPNVFQMNVANILPGDRIRVELDYTELLVPEEGVYEFVYPTVVGPRYSETKASDAPDEEWLENPYLHAGEAPPYTWGIDVELAAGMPVAGLRSPSHRLETDYRAEDHVRVTTPEAQGGDRDFVLRYRLAGDAIETGMLLYPGEDGEDGYFLAMLQPPERVRPEAIPPREYVFVVDVSGSMNGFPLDTAKVVMDDLLGSLRPTDTFNVMFFAGGSRVMSPHSVPATAANIQRAKHMVDRQRGGGGTRLLQALDRAFALDASEGTSRTFVVVTDGYVSFEAEAFERIRHGLGEANLFSFGIGTSVNRHLIEGMARVGQGEPFVVLDGNQAEREASRFATYVRSPVLTDVRVDFDGFDAHDVEPASIPDVFASRPVLVFGRYSGEPDGVVTLSGRTGEGRYERSLPVADYEPRPDHRALEYLWARHEVAMLGDLNKLSHDDDRVAEITRLGLEHSLMTAYTSFVAVDHRARNKGGESTTVKQPLPMPKGVPDTAVGGSPTGGNIQGFGSGGGGIRVQGRGKATVGRPGKGHIRARRTRNVKEAPKPMLDRTASSPPEAEPAPAEEREEVGSEASPDRDDDSLSPRVTLRVDTVRGPVDAEALRRALVEAHDDLVDCCGERLDDDPSLSGELRLDLVIDADGRILRAHLAKSTVGDSSLGRCVARILQRVKVAGVSASTLTKARITLRLSAR
ncbi:MAG: VIT domain-containing protein [Myxococcota bacterium]